MPSGVYKRKRKEESDPVAPVADNFAADKPEIPTDSPSPAMDATDSVAPARIPFKLIDGKLSFDGMRSKTLSSAKDAIRNALSDPDFCKTAGITKEQAQDAIGVSPAFVGMAFDVSGNIMAQVAAKRYGLPVEIVGPVVKFSSDEHAMLDKQWADIINKYFPGAWLKYTDIVVASGALLYIIQMKMKTVESLAMAQLERMNKETKPETDVPVSAQQPSNPASESRSLG